MEVCQYGNMIIWNYGNGTIWLGLMRRYEKNQNHHNQCKKMKICGKVEGGLIWYILLSAYWPSGWIWWSSSYSNHTVISHHHQIIITSRIIHMIKVITRMIVHAFDNFRGALLTTNDLLLRSSCASPQIINIITTTSDHHHHPHHHHPFTGPMDPFMYLSKLINICEWTNCKMYLFKIRILSLGGRNCLIENCPSENVAISAAGSETEFEPWFGWLGRLFS